MTERHFSWSGDALLPAIEPIVDGPEARLLVADSFLVTDGKSRGLPLHRERFLGSVATVPEAPRRIETFWDAALSVIPASGSWFPRFELLQPGQGEAPRLGVRLREAPAALGPARLWTLDQADPRTNRSVKGPELALGAQLRRRAALEGADEAILLDEAGYIAEGALSSLVWWHSDALYAPSLELEWLPSVTRRIVIELAQAAGYRVHLVKAKPADLVDCEVWLLSALNGIRVANEWIGLGAPLAKPKHAEAFALRLRLLEESIQPTARLS